MVLIIFMKKSLFIVSLQEMTFINLVLYTDGTYIIVLCVPFCNSAQYIFKNSFAKEMSSMSI